LGTKFYLTNEQACNTLWQYPSNSLPPPLSTKQQRCQMTFLGLFATVSVFKSTFLEKMIWLRVEFFCSEFLKKLLAAS
jgi:hypothetical protein